MNPVKLIRKLLQIVSDPSSVTSPYVGQIVIDSGGTVWQWNGSSWDILAFSDNSLVYDVDYDGCYLIDFDYDMISEVV